MRILLTNDDGIYAPGLSAALQTLSRLGEVYVVAPERPRSAAGHAITLHKPLRLTPVTLSNGMEGYACNGTPADCVTLGYEALMHQRCDLVVAGINAGANLGWDVLYSGTVAGAREGAILGRPSLAISLCLPENLPATKASFALAADFTARLAEQLVKHPLPSHVLLNVNIPHLHSPIAPSVQITRQGRREYVNRITVREDPNGKPYYWLGGSVREEELEPGTDVHAIYIGHISITPIQLDMTAYPLLEQLATWLPKEILANTNP